VEAEGLRARAQEFRERNAVPVGITFSSVADLARWQQALSYPFPLLSDADRVVAMAYGAAERADQEKAARLSVLVGPDGRVLRCYEAPDPASHAAQVIADLRGETS
jgi:peroxiredoxin